MNENYASTPVVTSILESEGEILLLLRSEKVGTYQGKWAGVAGFLENDPDTQALTEIREETGLKPERQRSAADVTLVRKAVPILVEDKERGWKWLVHPYLFHVRDKSKIRIDWEHQETRWIDPKDIEKYDTVPGLKEVLAAVYNAA